MNLFKYKNKILYRILFTLFIVIFLQLPVYKAFGQSSGDTNILTDEQKINNVLETYRQSSINKDLISFMSCFSRDFKRDSITYEIIENDVEKAFQSMDIVSCAISNVQITFNGETASVLCWQEIVRKDNKTGEIKKLCAELENLFKKEGVFWKIYCGFLVNYLINKLI